MSAMQLVGAVLVSIPFLAVTVVIGALIGWRPMAAIWALTIVTVALISSGCYLLAGGAQ